MEVSVVSIGALAKNPLWGERVAVRTSHATTTLVRSGKANVLVDPSLPGQVLAARLYERTGLAPESITHVFLTNWRPVHRRGLAIFEKAKWLIGEVERETAERALEEARGRAREERRASGDAKADEERKLILDSELALLKRVGAAEDEVAEGVDLFPLAGYTEGQCGLLVTAPTSTLVIAGDAVPTAGHFAAGQVFPDCWDLAKAKDSLMEMYEIADLIVPGHDNIFVTPRAGGI